ncbi:MAG TPA: TolC family protein [Terriglobales bacterium]|nr:TolC family protein [Terriglobales bacterium]
MYLKVAITLAAMVLALLEIAQAQNTAPQTTVSSPQSTVNLTLTDAITRARANSPQFQAALTQFGLAREDRVQARAVLLPNADYNNAFVYTQGNGTASGRFIANNGVHEYISQGAVQQVIGVGQFADYRRASAAQALARAKAEIAVRGLVVTVVQAYYGLQVAQAKVESMQAADDAAQTFLVMSRQLEQGGEVAHSDVIKAQIQANDQQRALEEARLAAHNARLNLAVLLFPNFFQDFTLTDDLAASPALPPMTDVQQLAQKNNPELAAAFAALNVANHELSVARAGHLPSLVLDYLYGIDANHFAVNTDGFRNLGYAATATLDIPVWHWGAIESKVKQAELQQHQAKIELNAAQRQAVADLQSFYSEAETAHKQLEILRNSADLAADSLRLTTLRYQSGEATALEVVDAQNTLTQARNNYRDGQARYHVAIANLQTLTGSF